MKVETDEEKALKLEIELLQCEKDVAHKRLDPYDVPDLFSWSKKYFIENGEVLTVGRYKFFCWRGSCPSGSAKNQFPEKLEGTTLGKTYHWADKCFPGYRNDDRPGVGYSNVCFLGFDDKWIVFLQISPNKCYMVDFEKKDQKGNTGFDFKPYSVERHFRKLWTTNGNFIGRDWIPEEVLELEDGFEQKWRNARKKYRKVLKKTGEAQKRAGVELSKKDVEQTNIRMKASIQANKVKDAVEQYLRDLDKETMTVEQIGSLYFELNELGSINKELKKTYGSKMK